MIVHVISPTEVHLYSSLDADRKREYLVEVNAELPDFRFGSFIDHENFVIALQSKFVPNEDRDLVLKFAGTVEDGTVAEYGDDGVTQKATIKTGVASKADVCTYNIALRYGMVQENREPIKFYFEKAGEENGN